MAEKEEEIKKIQLKAEKIKSLSLLRNIHKITPQIQTNLESDNVKIINALKSEKIIENSFLRLKGYFYNPLTKAHEAYRNPIMNERGLGNFISLISDMSEHIEFSSLDRKQIPKMAIYLFKINYPYFTIYCEEYELERSDFNLVASCLLSSIVATLNKAKGAGHRNVVRGTYSEDLLGKYVEDFEKEKRKSRIDLSQLNPFKKGRAI